MHSYHIAVGPISSNESFIWVSRDILDYLEINKLTKHHIHYFESVEKIPQQCEAVIFVKALPTLQQLRRLRSQRLFYIPVDQISHQGKIPLINIKLQQFEGILFHSDILAQHLYCPSYQFNIDHYTKYQVTRSDSEISDDAPVAWIGVYEYLPCTFKFLHNNNEDILKNIKLLSNINMLTSRRIRKLAHEFSRLGIPFNFSRFDEYVTINGIRIEQWSESSQSQLIARCRYVLDIKDDSFRQQTKPPTKCQIYVSSGIPVAVNNTHPAIEYLSKFNINLLTVEDVKKLSLPQLKQYGDQLKQQATDKFDITSVSKQYLHVLDVLQQPRPKTVTTVSSWDYIQYFWLWLKSSLSKLSH